MRATKQSAPWIYRLIGSAVIALAAILIGRLVFDSVPGLFLAEASLGGLAGGKYRAVALSGAVMAFLAYVGFEILRNNRAFQGEDSLVFLILFLGMIIFVVSALAGLFFMKKLDAG